MKTPEQYLKNRIRLLLIFFITGLVLSGLTAFPIESELSLLATNHPSNSLQQWINTVYHAVTATNARYPFMAYGTDWLAVAHIVIAIAFVGPLRDPVRNIWVLQFGMIACVLIFPLAFIAGPVREIPIGWSLVDCCFGVVGVIPLYICYRYARKLEELVK
ncbi:MAG TPA: hypothetical protein VIM89_03535 [Mucilaginibacter sp.]